MTDASDLPVEHDPDGSRFVVHTPSGDAMVEYQRAKHLIVFTHTEVPREEEGEGLGSRIVRAALDWARAEGEPVMPLCPFVAAFIRRHPEYRDLVMPGVGL